MKETYLYVVVDILIETDSVLAYRKVLGKFIIVMKNIDPDAVVTEYEDQSDRSNSYIYNYKNKCINSVESIPTSITQLQKFFPKGRLKKLGRTVFTNALVVYNEDIEGMIEDLKIGLERYNGKVKKKNSISWSSKDRIYYAATYKSRYLRIARIFVERADSEVRH